jgi:protein-S-isoprenylcysteine O-methyltransferase Ste14
MNAPAVDRAFAERLSALYLPLIAALFFALLRRRSRLRFAACLLGFLWTTPALLLLQLLNLKMDWWYFPDVEVGIRGMPLELYGGWIILWGILPALAFPRLRLALVAAVMAGFDLIAMPDCSAVVHLNKNWLVGEAAAIVFVLLPSLCLARWTQQGTHLALRATLQVATSGLLFLFLIPETVFAFRPSYNWTPLLAMQGGQRQLALLMVMVLALPGVGAVQEFTQRGDGTPIPYDPPKRLLTSGIYRYLANPMQISCTLVMLLWAALLRNPWLVLAPFASVIYSAGIARWDERQDLAARFGAPWRDYRNEVHDWLPRLIPYHHDAPARLYIATTCVPCSQLQRWVESQSPRGMEIMAAESLLVPIERITYDPSDGSPSVSGIRAVGRALEHMNLAWALAGIALRLPGVWQLVQLIMDVSGFGPRVLPNPNACQTHVN